MNIERQTIQKCTAVHFCIVSKGFRFMNCAAETAEEKWARIRRENQEKRDAKKGNRKGQKEKKKNKQAKKAGGGEYATNNR